VSEGFTISIDGLQEMAGNFTAAATRGAAAGIQEAILLLERAVQEKIMAGRTERHFGPSVVAGTLESSIVSEMSQAGMNPEGFVGVAPPADEYALVLEEGRTPGARMPPSDALLPWVMEKLGSGVEASTSVVEGKAKGKGQKAKGRDPEKAARGLAYVIARSIGEKGFPGVHMFGNTVAEQEQNVVELVREKVQESVREELAGRG